ncbi:hypothetical protein DIS24_g10421 [Lasiodiplodia hormozganensis]|uniref:Formylmethionine deformylase-like protein n=1 Tax=Lasiodiplodia hormozganensis TaxID=869390 RepID=A0AA39XPI6_9PEZI|nr:hypothetical protein DIS24_g10421 [Lasiodiplodia hormozganensis]
MHSPLERIDEHQSESAWENYPSHRRSSPVLGRSSPDSLSSDSTGWTNASTLRTQPPSLFDERKIQPQITGFQSISDDASTLAALPQSPWGVHWKSPTLMVSLFTLGVSFCVAHHLFYGYLDGTAVGSSESQQWAIRAGTALALLAKAFLAASVGVALTQRLWMTLRAKPFSIQGLDNAFSLPADPTSLFSGEVMGHAKLLWLMAAAMWCIPIIATVTPATLTVNLGLSINITSARVPSLSYENGASWGQYDGEQRLIGAAIPLHRILAATATTGDVVRMSAPFSNSSYTTSFFGPSLQCYNLSAVYVDPSDVAVVAQHKEAFESVIKANMQRSKVAWDEDHIYLGAISNASNLSSTIFINVQGTQEHNITCNLWQTAYTVHHSFPADGTHTSIITSLNRTSAVQIAGGNNASAYTPEQTAFYSWTTALTSLLATRIANPSSNTSSSSSNNPLTAPLLNTNLASCPELLPTLNQTSSSPSAAAASTRPCRAGTLLHALEDLSYNYTLSLLSSAPTSGSTTTELTTRRPITIYAYAPLPLLAAYGTATCVALLCLLAGARAYVANGFSGSRSFSAILLTTRNTDLDRLVEGHCLPARPVEKGLRGTKLRYGTLAAKEKSVAGQEHAGFGFVGTVRTVRRGDVCA